MEFDIAPALVSRRVKDVLMDVLGFGYELINLEDSSCKLSVE